LSPIRPAQDDGAAPAVVEPVDSDSAGEANGQLPATEPASAPSLPTLETCARLAAKLDLLPEKREALLADATLTESEFVVGCEHWAELTLAELAHGSQDLLRRFDDLYVITLEIERGPIEPDERARIERAAECGRREEALRTHRLPAAGWMRIERVWIRRLCRDPILRARYFAALSTQ
jgi:hypothetical protein